MLQSINTCGCEQHDSAASMIDQITVMVEMPVRFEGRKVSSRAVMISLLWQQYGLDLLHPAFSRWLERNAPDVKYEVAQNSVKNGVNAGLRVGADGKVKVQLPLEFDQRLRDVSSRYMRWQIEPKLERKRQYELKMERRNPEMEQRRPEMEVKKPEMEQRRPEMEQRRPGMKRRRLEIEGEEPNSTIVYLNKPAAEMEQEEPISTIVYLNNPAVSPKMDYYELAS